MKDRLCAVQLRPIAGKKYEPGPHHLNPLNLEELWIEEFVSLVVSDLESLCVIPGESVYGVMVDIHVVNDSGNIFDASALAAIAALRTTIVPALASLILAKTTLEDYKNTRAHLQELAADLSWMQVLQKN